MSADNGIYILKSPTKDGGVEYRVAHVQAIEDIEYGGTDERLKTIKNRFDHAPVFKTREEALIEADKQYHEVLDDIGILEYGISFVETDLIL